MKWRDIPKNERPLVVAAVGFGLLMLLALVGTLVRP
jgi:hypothetical protein